MEEAAKKVESDMEEMKKNYKERIKKQDQVIAKMKSALELQSKKNNVSEARLEKLENQLKVTVHSNLSLDADLQLATKTIVIFFSKFLKIPVNFLYLSRLKWKLS